jgi:hypothetical protein
VWAVASLPAGSASADGEHRRHIRRNKKLGEGWRARPGAGGSGGGGLSAPASPPPRTARAPPSLPRIASACACTRAAVRFGRLCGAAQRYPLRLSWTAPSAPRMSSSAIASDRPLAAAKCSGVHLHGRRGGDSAGALRQRRSGKNRTRCSGSGRSRRRRMRRAIGRFGDCRIAPQSEAR